MDKEILKAALSGDSTSMHAGHGFTGPNHPSWNTTDVVVLQEWLLMEVNLDKETPLLAADDEENILIGKLVHMHKFLLNLSPLQLEDI